MKIDIPDEIAEKNGIKGLNVDQIRHEVIELAWSVQPNPSGKEKDTRSYNLCEW
jgi:hypothetical protein